MDRMEPEIADDSEAEPLSGAVFSGMQGSRIGISRPFDVLAPARTTCPLIFNSPHSGSLYPTDLIAASGLDMLSLRRSEDSFVDRLFEDAPQFGAPLLKALFPRAYLDVNREAFELDPTMFDAPLPGHVNTRSLRVTAGFGTIARVVADGMPIYRHKLAFAEAERRVKNLYLPYHSALSSLLEQSVQRFGCAVLVDCHSMPSLGAPLVTSQRRTADIVLGDRYGTSCDATISQAIEDILTAQGYQVLRNAPYAGGYITDFYGKPALGQHAIQIEINRGLYMDERLMTLADGFARLKAHMTVLIESLSRSLAAQVLLPKAAE